MTTALLQSHSPGPPALRDAPLYEVVNGSRVELPEMSALSNRIKSRLHIRLGAFVEGAGLGQTAVESLFVLSESESLQRRPDVAFISRERWPLDREPPWEGEWPVVPNLCVEVTSPSDLFDDVMDKVMEYLEHGVEEVWVIWPPGSHVQVFKPNDSALLAGKSALTTPLLPDFSLHVSELFAS